MKQARILLMTLLISCFAATSSCSQKKPGSNIPPTEIFIGSTPCDSFIKSSLRIHSNTKCDFIKWELSLEKSRPDSFQLTAFYGESKPNTNGFIGGGQKIVESGRYAINHGSDANPKAKIYYLHSDKFQVPLLLIEMDSNVLHFLDDKKKFIVGNGGWGYVLNRVQ